jgi:protoheme IX farnesyltransferase
MPIIGGYVAYSDHLNGAAVLIGLMMLLWQMPHFYAIALFREAEYRKANIPLLPIVKGHEATTRAMIIYNALFLISVISLYFYSKLSIAYILILGLSALAWLIYNLKGLKLESLKTWSRRSFAYSLAIVVVMSLMIALH